MTPSAFEILTGPLPESTAPKNEPPSPALQEMCMLYLDVIGITGEGDFESACRQSTQAMCKLSAEDLRRWIVLAHQFKCMCPHFPQ